MRWRFWGLVLVLVMAGLSGCGGASSSGGTNQAALPLRNEVLSTAKLVAQPEQFATPWDATPDPDGQQIYFTASGTGGVAVLRVPADGSAAPVVLASGAPFAEPRGLSISTDGQQLYIADPKASGDDGKSGRVFAIPSAGGMPTVVPGTAGIAPRGLEVVRQQNIDVLYIAGNVLDTTEPAVFKLPLDSNGSLTVLAKGAPLREPVGLAVTSDGTLLVADRLAAGTGKGSVFRMAVGGVLEQIAGPVRTGLPVVGAALTLDEQALLVSALAPDRDSAQVLLIELGTLKQGIVNKGIAANTGSGGVHRAHNRNFFAWADTTLPGMGRKGGVYALTP